MKEPKGLDWGDRFCLNFGGALILVGALNAFWWGAGPSIILIGVGFSLLALTLIGRLNIVILELQEMNSTVRRIVEGPEADFISDYACNRIRQKLKLD